MRVIGIDLGTICCGYGIVEVDSSRSTVNSQLTYITSGEIRMNKRDTLPERLKILYDSFKVILKEYKPSHLCIEKIFYHKSIQSAFTLGSTRGVTMLLSAKNSIPVFEYSAAELKMALTGYGRAEKQQVQDMVIRVLNLAPKSNSSAAFGVTLRQAQGDNCHGEPVEPSVERSGQDLKLSLDAADALALCICHINNYKGYNRKRS